MLLFDAMKAPSEDITCDQELTEPHQEDFYPDESQGKTSDEMLMRINGLINKSDRMCAKEMRNCYIACGLYYDIFYKTDEICF